MSCLVSRRSLSRHVSSSLAIITSLWQPSVAGPYLQFGMDAATELPAAGGAGVHGHKSARSTAPPTAPPAKRARRVSDLPSVAEVANVKGDFLVAEESVSADAVASSSAKKPRVKAVLSPHAGPPTWTSGGYIPAANMAEFTATVAPRRPGYFKVLSHNVNGLRAWAKDDKLGAIRAWIAAEDPDVLCLQEIKIDDLLLASFRSVFPTLPHAAFSCCTTKKGYAGVAVFSKTAPVSVTKSIGAGEFDSEGRTLIVEYPGVTVINTYVPNSGQKLDRLDARTHVWDPALRSTCISLAAKQPLLLVGDLNVAFHDCDIHDPKTNRNKSAGFCDGERDGFAALLAAGMHDTWRERNPDVQQFTYWTPRFKCRDSNKGWRLDYVLSSADIAPTAEVFVRHNFPGVDHIPLGVEVKLPLAPVPSAATHIVSAATGAAVS